MADLTGSTIASTYKDLLQVSNSNSGIDSTLRVIEDGEGTESILSISSSAAKISSSSQLQFRDSAIHISSDADGYLNVQADTGVNINIGGTDELAVTATTSTFGTNLVIPDSGTIGNASDTDLLTFTSGVLTVAGELDATTLDISGNADIDGTLEADAITVDGVALATFIRDTVGTNMLSSNTESGITVTYDTSNDNIDFSIDAAQTTITSLLATDIKIGEDDQTKIDFETADEIHFYAANVEQVYLGDNIFGPQSDSDVDLGSDSVRWKDAYIDTVTTTGNVTIAGTLSVSDGNITNVGDIALDSISADNNTMDITLTDNQATALEIKESTNSYLTFVTTNSSEKIQVHKALDIDAVSDFGSNAMTNVNIDSGDIATAVTVGGSDTITAFVQGTAGAMVSSNTESGIAVTYQDSDETIDFAISAAQTGITSLLATDIKIGEDDQTKIDFETADEIHFYAANVEQVYLGDNIFGPQSDSDVDLGSDSVRWKDAYIDTITTTGNVTVAGTLSLSDGNITNVGDINVDSVSSDDGSGFDFLLDDNKATALEIKESSNAYLTFVTTDSGEKITLGKKLEAGSVEIEGSAFDINGGTIDATDVTVGSGKTLDVSAGTLTLANDQISGDKVTGGTIGSVTITALAGDISVGDNDITNVGNIALDTISSDAGTSVGVTLGTDAGDDFNVGSGKLVVEGDTSQTGINTATPTEKLEVNGGIIATNSANRSAGEGIVMDYVTGSDLGRISVADWGTAYEPLQIEAETYTLDVGASGNILARHVTNTGSAIFNTSVGVGRIGANNIAVDDDSTIALTDNNGSANHVYIYERGSGSSGIFTVGYAFASAVVVSAGHTFSTSDTDGAICLISGANSHTITFKNRIGSTGNFRIMMVGAGTPAPI